MPAFPTGICRHCEQRRAVIPKSGRMRGHGECPAGDPLPGSVRNPLTKPKPVPRGVKKQALWARQVVAGLEENAERFVRAAQATKLAYAFYTDDLDRYEREKAAYDKALARQRAGAGETA